MSAIWSSSERPMSVRTVWVDGIRHVILSQDDPLLSVLTRRRRWRPRISTAIAIKDNNLPLKFDSSEIEAQDGTHKDSFDNCLVNLHLVTEKSVVKKACRDGLLGLLCRQSAPPRLYTSNSAESFDAVEVADQLAAQPGPTNTSTFHGLVDPSRTQSDGRISSRTKQQPKSVASVSPLDTLSDRVLQWLDLPRSRERSYFTLEDTPRTCQAILPYLDRCVGAGGVRTLKRQFSSFSQDGSCMKIVVPTQCLVIQANSAIKQSDNRRQRSELGQNIDLAGAQPNPSTYTCLQTINPITMSPIKVNNQNVDRPTTSDSLWTLPGKPQLHIFMPNF